MSLLSSLSDLQQGLERQRDSLQALQTTVREDGPCVEDFVLIDIYNDLTEDALDQLTVLLIAVNAALHSLHQRPGIGQVIRALSECNASFQALEKLLFEEMLATDRLVSLSTFANQNGGQWRPWSQVVRNSLLEIQRQSRQANRELLACWQELGERLYPLDALNRYA